MESISDDLRNLTRTGGILYLVVIVCGMYAELAVISQLVAGNDSAATANNILSNEALYRSGTIAHIVTVVSGLFLMGILFSMFKSTSSYLAVCMVIFNTVALTIESVSILYEFETISILKSKMLASAFLPEQTNALAYLPLRMQTIGYDLGLLFFGIVCCLIAVLILKSKLFARWVGFLMLLAGMCYITNSLTSFISPVSRAFLLPWILVPCFVAELSLTISMILGRRPTVDKVTIRETIS